MLIRRAEIEPGRVTDLRIGEDTVLDLGRSLERRHGEDVVDAGGAALIAGLHDHHIHLTSLAAARRSVRCGPPDVQSAEQLAGVLAHADREAGREDVWLRGVGYHDSVAGPIDRRWLDQWVRRRPARIQHRSGRLWILNSRAIEQLDEIGDDAPLERVEGHPTGRLFDGDAWLRARLPRSWPDLAEASEWLARRGVTNVTDATPRNGPDDFARFSDAQSSGSLRQRLVVMGSPALFGTVENRFIRVGATKFHLHEARLPDFDGFVDALRASHAHRRPVAVHCVTRVELIFTLEALRAAGSLAGDRIEHGSVIPDHALSSLRDLGLLVVTQPNFVFERGDTYRYDVDAEDQPFLYRAKSLLDAGIPLAAGSDAPFGHPDPWRAMQAAVERRSAGGHPLGPAEALSPEEALALYSAGAAGGDPPAVGVAPGMPSDLCLLDRPWQVARTELSAVQVRMTWKCGQCIWSTPT